MTNQGVASLPITSNYFIIDRLKQMIKSLKHLITSIIPHTYKEQTEDCPFKTFLFQATTSYYSSSYYAHGCRKIEKKFKFYFFVTTNQSPDNVG
jgi:hypothetical protein